jgi:hypothetical protein
MRLCLISTELKVKDFFLLRPVDHDPQLSSVQRLQDLESILVSVEQLLAAFADIPLLNWVGIDTNSINQFTHCLIVLFKLTTLKERDWDVKEVVARADVLKIIDDFCDKVDQLRQVTGMIDSENSQRGLYFKTHYLFKTVKALMMMEMSPEVHAEPPDQYFTTTGGFAGDFFPPFLSEAQFPDEFILNLANEPLLFDLMDYS